MLEPIDFIRLEKRTVDEVPPDVLKYVEDALEVLSHSYKQLDPNFRLVPADHHPGYLTTDRKNWHIFVPWPLVRLCPSDEVLDDLLQVGTQIACDPVENLCISGSSAMLGGAIEIGDLDFCQYVRAVPADIIATAATFKVAAPGRVLTRATYGDNPVLAVAIAPWTDWSKLEGVMLPVKTIDGAKRFMIDFLAITSTFGILPMSNVVLASDFKNHYGGAAQGSFVYQEAIAVRKDSQPPWGLYDPRQIARYLTFLRAQIDQYKSSKPIKAVKRALSLAFTIRLWDHVKEALDILRSPDCVAYIRSSRADELEQQAKRGGAAAQAMLLKYVKNHPHEGAADFSHLQDRCERFIDGLMATLAKLDRKAGA
jgi:hypothetical protein